MTRLLIVPSDEYSATIYRSLLKHCGYESPSFADSQTALARISEDLEAKLHYTGFIIDINRIDADTEQVEPNEGTALLKVIRQFETYKTIPCIVGTHQFLNSTFLARKYAPADIISKPIRNSSEFAKLSRARFGSPS
jgi:CheY-like chemotaxis protein